MNSRFRAVWGRSVIERHVATFVVQAMERGHDVTAITDAMNEIDRILGADPAVAGESRDDLERVLIVSPLSVDFEVHDEEQLVYVLRARYAPRRLG
jgi:hypothetical protein